jgi:putative ABC transport system substrate-binding protein
MVIRSRAATGTTVRARGVLVALVTGLVLAVLPPAILRAQPVPARVGVLLLTSPEADNSRRALDLRDGLRELGYVEGRTIVFEYRYAGGRPDRLTPLAVELVKARVDVIVSVGFQATIAARVATRTVPIVMAPAGDPVAQGLVESLARPGGNVTGVALMTTEVRAKRLALFRLMLPRLRRVAVVLEPNLRRSTLKDVETSATAMGVQIEWVEVAGPRMLDSLAGRLRDAQVQGVYTAENPIIDGLAPRIAEIARQQRLPSVFAFRDAVEAGGLMSYGTSFPNTQRRAATYVQRILNGANPAELPIEQAERFELVVNLRTARAIGVTVPPSILVQADQVIE